MRLLPALFLGLAAAAAAPAALGFGLRGVGLRVGRLSTVTDTLPGPPRH